MSEWLEVKVETTPEGLDWVGERLISAGISGYVIEDEEEFLNFLENNHEYWDYVDDKLLESKRGQTCVKFYVTNDESGHAQLDRVKEELSRVPAGCPEAGVGVLGITLATLREEDWENNWKQYYKPMPVGRKLYIVPEWERTDMDNGRIPLILNPGLIFGTGMHPSTKMCLVALEDEIAGGERVLDLGCGSGILSIAALRLGASCAMGCDIDPKAVDVAYENAAFNGIGRDALTVGAGNVLTDAYLMREIGQRKYDVVLANIVADVIISLSDRVSEYLAEEGIFICSGIIDTRAGEVAAALEKSGFAIEKREMDGWVCYIARLK